MLVPYADVTRTAFHQEFALKYDLSRLMTVALAKTGAFTGISVTRPHRAGPFGTEAVKYLEAIAPHAERALGLGRHLATSSALTLSALDVLEGITAGVILGTADGRIQHANRTARQILSARDGLKADQGLLTGATSDGTAALQALCARAAAFLSGEVQLTGGALRISRPSGKRPLEVVVQPAPPSEGLTPQRVDSTVVIFAHDPEIDPLPNIILLQRFYSFTPAEAQFAARLATGLEVNDIAEQLHYTRETARWYARQVLSKAGCRSRAQFVRHVARGLATITTVK